MTHGEVTNYTPAEAAPKLRVQRKTVWTWIRQGKLKAAHVGRKRLIPASEIERMLTPQ